jgi:hypothetical protein
MAAGDSTLLDALLAGLLSITEIGSGTVPTLLATNDGSTDVLVLDGEQLIGARQNRMINRTVLLPGKSRTEITVSCMEQGRWRPVSPEMKAGSEHSPPNVRRDPRRTENDCVAEGAVADQDVLGLAQGNVWRHIAGYGSKLGATSRTGALNDYFAAAAPRIDDFLRAFRSSTIRWDCSRFSATDRSAWT